MLMVETWPVARLIPYARNPRKNDAAVDRMCAAIREFGFRIPVVARSDGTVVDGHLRLKAAQRLGLAEVPVALADDLSEAQIKAFRLLANRSAAWAEWDDELLALELQDLQGLDYDLALTGFDADALAELFADKTGGLTDPDEAPAAPAVPVSRKGDLWLCGSHRLLCGDSTGAEEVNRLLAGAKPDLMVTDPPYGVEYDAAKARKRTADSATGKVLNDDRSDWAEAWKLFLGSVAYVWHGMRTSGTVFRSLEISGFEVRSEIVWDKGRLVMSRGHYHPQHESCWYAVRGTANWHGGSKQSTVWSIQHLKSETGHSTQKPVECMRRPIVNNSSPGQAVYEPFCGSGTTMIAAEMEGRHAYCMELSETYCDVIVKRWQAFTGRAATLEGDGRTFDEVRHEREEGSLQEAAEEASKEAAE